MTPVATIPAGGSGLLSRLALGAALVAAVTIPLSVHAQEPDGRAPAYVAAVDGAAQLDRPDGTEAVERGMPVVEGDRLRTEAGRLELVFPDGSQVYLDRFGEVELVEPLVLRLVRGRAYVRLAATRPSPERLIIDAPGANVRFREDGRYRIAVGGLDGVQVELAVSEGAADLASEAGTVLVSTGEFSRVRDGGAPSPPEWFNASGETPLEQWAREREQLWRSGLHAQSRTYLPNELVSYGGTFDRYGSWDVDATYGHVWYPTVAADWRPYYQGRWHHVPRYGWTWIAHDPWGWPTHHYGRWHIGARGWFWIPSRAWGPAWVYWAVSPGYVGWCPLGWNGRPVINVFNFGAGRHDYPRHRDPYRAWTVIPDHQFGRSSVPVVRATRVVLDRERPTFVMQHVPPGFAAPRSPFPRVSRDGGAAPPRRPGMSTMAPRADSQGVRPGMSGPPSGGRAVPRTYSSSGADDENSPYERARRYQPRPGTVDRQPVYRPPVGRDPGDDDADGGTYRRRPSYGDAPARGPGAVPRSPRDDDREPSSGGRGGYMAPPRRGPDRSPGMSAPPSGDAPRPGMSGPPSGGHAVPRGGRSDGEASAPPSRSSGESSSGRSGGGAVRRHPPR